MTDDKGKLIHQATKERDDGRRVLACAKAFELSSNNGMTLAEISTYCNENNIKIVGCQLRCFK